MSSRTEKKAPRATYACKSSFLWLTVNLFLFPKTVTQVITAPPQAVWEGFADALPPIPLVDLDRPVPIHGAQVVAANGPGTPKAPGPPPPGHLAPLEPPQGR